MAIKAEVNLKEIRKMNTKLEEMRKVLIHADEEELKLESNITNITYITDKTNTTNKTKRSFLKSAETISATPRFGEEMTSFISEGVSEGVSDPVSERLIESGIFLQKKLREADWKTKLAETTLQAQKEIIQSEGKWISQDDISYCKISIFLDNKDRFYLNSSIKSNKDNKLVNHRSTLTMSKYDFAGNIKKWRDYQNFPQYQNLCDMFETAKKQQFLFWAGKMRPPKKRLQRQQKMAPLTPLCTAYMKRDDLNDTYIVGVYIHDFHIELQYEKYLCHYENESKPYFTVEFRPGIDKWEV